MIERHVVNYDLSKRLHELGVIKPSIFYWYDGLRKKMPVMIKYCSDHVSRNATISAYTASELLEMLPGHINYKNVLIYYLDFQKREDHEDYQVMYADYERNQFNDFILGDVFFSNALAKMLIYLIEKKLVDVNQINQGENT